MPPRPGPRSLPRRPETTDRSLRHAGARLLATPSKAGLDHPELRSWLDRYLPGADGGDTAERSRLFRTAWDFVGSALGGRAEIYERNYLVLGSPRRVATGATDCRAAAPMSKGSGPDHGIQPAAARLGPGQSTKGVE